MNINEEQIQGLIDNGFSINIINAGIACGIRLDNLGEAYEGEYDSDEDFARQYANDTNAIDDDAIWPHNCIDWGYAAKELMYEFVKARGYYFRNI